MHLFTFIQVKVQTDFMILKDTCVNLSGMINQQCWTIMFKGACNVRALLQRKLASVIYNGEETETN